MTVKLKNCQHVLPAKICCNPVIVNVINCKYAICCYCRCYFLMLLPLFVIWVSGWPGQNQNMANSSSCLCRLLLLLLFAQCVNCLLNVNCANVTKRQTNTILKHSKQKKIMHLASCCCGENNSHHHSYAWLCCCLKAFGNIASINKNNTVADNGTFPTPNNLKKHNKMK